MVTIDEKAAFSRRLLDALNQAGINVISPTLVAREFNKRYRDKPVTTQAVRKWITGESIPAQEKIRVLAKWLDVSAQWLRFGEEEKRPGTVPVAELRTPDRGGGACRDHSLADGFGRLSHRHKEMIREMVVALLKLEDKG